MTTRLPPISFQSLSSINKLSSPFSLFFSNVLDTHISLFGILNFLLEAGTSADRSSLDSPDWSTGVHDLVEAQELHEESKLSPP